MLEHSGPHHTSTHRNDELHSLKTEELQWLRPDQASVRQADARLLAMR